MIDCIDQQVAQLLFRLASGWRIRSDWVAGPSEVADPDRVRAGSWTTTGAPIDGDVAIKHGVQSRAQCSRSGGLFSIDTLIRLQPELAPDTAPWRCSGYSA